MRRILFILVPFQKVFVEYYTHFIGILLIFFTFNSETSAKVNKSFMNEWKKLLHFEDGQKQVVSTEFYISKAHQPQDEFNQFIRILKTDKAKELVCNFPARYKLIQKHFPSILKINLRECQSLNDFLRNIKGDKISLGLASEYFKAPSSAFGHLMLVIHENSKPSVSSSVIHYAAKTNPTDGFLSYTMKGLTGAYYGYYLKTNLFDKLNEYSKIEQRFIHYYELNLDPDQLHFLKLHLFELRKARFKYFFLNKNCAYRLGKIIDLSSDHIYTPNNFIYTMPIEIPKSFSPIITQATAELPYISISKQSTESLSKDDLKLFHKIIEGKDKLKKGSSTHLKKAVFYYYNYHFRKENSHLPNYKENMVFSITEEKTTSKAFDPRNSPSPNKFEVSKRWISKDQSFNLRYRPVLRDIETPARLNFYESEMNIAMIDLSYHDEKKFKLDEFQLLNLKLLSDYSSLYKDISWALYLGVNRKNDNDFKDYEISFGLGQGKNSILSFAYVLNVGLSYIQDDFYPILKPEIYLYTFNIQKFKFLSKVTSKIRKEFSYFEVENSLSYFFTSKSSIKLKYLRNKKNLYQAGFTYHF